MRRISAYIIRSLFMALPALAGAQDTIMFPLKIKAALELTGPAIYFTNKDNLSSEAYVAVDLNERIAAVLSGGFLRYRYSQYNYDYRNNGIFFKAGTDFNLRNPKVGSDKYWAGIGLRYGISFFKTETPSFRETNYWGTTWSSIPPTRSAAHFVEFTPGIRSEVFRNFSIGWSLSMRLLLYNGTGKDNKPIYLPGFGNSDSRVSAGIGYFVVWNIPFKKIRYIVKPEEPEEEPEDQLLPAGTTPSPGFGPPR